MATVEERMQILKMIEEGLEEVIRIITSVCSALDSALDYAEKKITLLTLCDNNFEELERIALRMTKKQYYAFGFSGNLLMEGKTLEQILIEAIEKRGPKGFLGLLQKNPLSDTSLMAICDATSHFCW
jgi:hypothetical protein